MSDKGWDQYWPTEEEEEEGANNTVLTVVASWNTIDANVQYGVLGEF